jgi:hypothetical protein
MVPAPDRNVYSMQLIINLRGSERAKARVEAVLALASNLFNKCLGHALAYA